MAKIPICEIFSSIQGEGYNLGKPVVFVRFYGCNLRCQFKDKNCDTPYAVIDDKYVKHIKVSEIKSEILKHSPSHIVFTGGEPMLYQKEMIEIMRQLNRHQKLYTAEIETNGTIPILSKRQFNKYIQLINISVKLKSSNQESHEYDFKRINYDALNSLYLPHKACFKFVYTGKKDLKEIELLVEHYPKMHVYLMPEGQTRKEIIKNAPKVVEMCMTNPLWHYSPREHIMIWDNKKGV